MLIPVLLAAASAQSEPAATADFTCASFWPTHIAPADGADGVPLDAHLMVVLQGDCGGGGVLTLSDASGVVAEWFDAEVELTRAGALLDVVPPEDLAPETEYTASFESWNTELLSTTFVTGSDLAGGPAESVDVSVDSIDAEWIHGVLWAHLSISLSGGEPGAIVRVAERESASATLVGLDAQGSGSVQLSVRAAANATEVCAVAAQHDAVGDLSDWTEACAPFEAPPKPVDDDDDVDSSGCSTVPGPTGLLLGLMVLPLLRRR